jgi:hypothetical protein
MANITVNEATLARQVNGEIEYVYPKTRANLVEYDSTQNIKEKIDNKLDLPVNEDGNSSNGTNGQVLVTNGDGSTSWETFTRVYVGSGDMPDGYDVQIDPNAEAADIDSTLSIEGAVADAKATGDAIDELRKEIGGSSIRNEIAIRDQVTGEIYILRMENGELIYVSKCSSISITKMPNKTTYTAGQTFDPTGMIITAECENGNTREINNYTYNKEPITSGLTEMEISYTELGETYTVIVPITVN